MDAHLRGMTRRYGIMSIPLEGPWKVSSTQISLLAIADLQTGSSSHRMASDFTPRYGVELERLRT